MDSRAGLHLVSINMCPRIVVVISDLVLIVPESSRYNTGGKFTGLHHYCGSQRQKQRCWLLLGAVLIHTQSTNEETIYSEK